MNFDVLLLLIHVVISCAIAKGGALRERGNVRTSGGSISIVGNGIAYNNWLYAIKPFVNG